MPRHHETRRLAYSSEQMFDLVADVARYGEFLPWVVAVRTRSDTPVRLVADIVVGFAGLREHFTSQVDKQRPATSSADGRIHVEYLDGPLKYLRNDWFFVPAGQGCTIDFTVDFAFKSRVFELLAGQVFGAALRRMITAFEERAAALYDSGGSDGTDAPGKGVGSSSSSAHSAA